MRKSLTLAGMTHGVTENTAGLTYSGESGGLNEATSDIFGTMVEFYASNAGDPGDYLVGEEFDLRQHTGFRRMDNPASDGDSLNRWSATAGSADVHYSSGTGNHFSYLLAEGSGPKTIGGVAHSSPTCNGSTVSGLGRDAAARIWYRALTVYMTSSTSYKGARTATLNAARDLHGARAARRTTRSLRHGAQSPCPDLPPPREVSGPLGGGPVLGTRAPRPLLRPLVRSRSRVPRTSEGGTSADGGAVTGAAIPR